MAHLLSMMEDPAQRDARTDDEGRAVDGRMLEYVEDLKARGLLDASESLASTKDAVRPQKRDGKCLLVDGPFTEARE